jgi:hypothetical protein
MDQKENQGQQSDRPRSQGHPHDEEGQHRPSSSTDNREKGRGDQVERNLGGGISNRDMDRELEEQEELPDRGSRQSER